VRGHPDLEKRSLRVYTASVEARPGEDARISQVLRDLEALLDLEALRATLVVGCGPAPSTVQLLRCRGYKVIAVEPIPSFVDAARAFLGTPEAVLQGTAEALPVPDETVDLIFLESVLEHVDSPRRALEEAHRVLRPGGVVFITTTNRHALNPTCAEFNVPFFGWLPRLVKESYVFFHLHYRPWLANYTERPAVHWFTFTDLCVLGRDAGFANFYSHLDLRFNAAKPGASAATRLRSLLLRGIQANPLLRTLALTQRGGVIFMTKRAQT
jgi:ubiquinone/menaquinone biosynthesis C-methylase UbiE